MNSRSTAIPTRPSTIGTAINANQKFTPNESSSTYDPKAPSM